MCLFCHVSEFPQGNIDIRDMTLKHLQQLFFLPRPGSSHLQLSLDNQPNHKQLANDMPLTDSVEYVKISQQSVLKAEVVSISFT